MAFDPDAYLAQKTTQGKFDPDAYLKAKGATPEISQTESALRGAAQGATFGFAPAISGAAQALPTALGAATGSNSMQDILTAYNKGREASKAEFDAAQQANPKTYFAGSLAGSLAPAMLTGGLSEEASAAQGLSALTKGALSPVTSAAALTGAGYGALSGAGEAVSGGESLGQSAKDIASGAVGGAILGGTLSKLGSYLPTAESIEESANEQAVKSLGPQKKQFKLMNEQDTSKAKFAASQGLPTPEKSIQKLGGDLLEKNLGQETPVVTALAGKETMLERAIDLSNRAGESMGTIQKQLDSSFNNPEMIDKFVNPNDLANEVQKQLLDPIMHNGKVPASSNGIANAVSDVVSTITDFGNDPISFEEAQKLKGLITNLANYEQQGSPNNQILKRAGGIINAGIEDAAEEVASASGDSNLLDQYRKAKQLYGSAQTAIKASTSSFSGEQAGRAVGLTDTIAAAGGLAHGGSPEMMIAGAGNKLMRTYGNQVAAAGASGVSKGISGMSKMLVDAPKESIVSFGQQMINSGEPLATSLGNVLVRAGERDDIGRNALMYSIMQNASYRELLRKYTGQKEQVK